MESKNEQTKFSLQTINQVHHHLFEFIQKQKDFSRLILDPLEEDRKV